MRSSCTRALTLLAGLAVAAPAAAQYNAPRSLPPVTGPSNVVTASYDLPATNNGPSGSMFVGQTPTPALTPDDSEPAQGALIDGAAVSSDFQEAVANEWCENSGCGAGGAWFASAGALVMGRSRPNAYWTSVETNVNNPVLNTQSAGADWTGGWQVNIAYLFGGGGCGCPSSIGPYAPAGAGCCGAGPGLGFSYWGLGNMGGFAQVDSSSNDLQATFSLLDPSTGSGQVEIGGQPFSDFFDNSASHRITRDNGTSNYELNVYFGAFKHYRWTVMPFAGFRYFHYDERLAFAGLTGGSSWGANGGQDQAELSFRTVNDLYGLQLGTYANYLIAGRFNWFIGPKVGLFGNQMSNRAILARGDGLQAFDVNANKSDFALMGEIDTGFSWFFGEHFMTYMGYRVLGVTNVALADNEFIQGIGDVKQSGSLILHGVMVGGGWSF